MTKALRSINNNVDLSRINFSGFSNSKGWIGYFERKGEFSLQIVDEAIHIMYDYFSFCWEDFFALSALAFLDRIDIKSETILSDDEMIVIEAETIVTEDDPMIIETYDKIYQDAKNNNYLKPISDTFESYLYGDIALPASSLSLHFDNDKFLDISKLLMSHGGVRGEVFFMINPKLMIAVYPHEGTGFGVISLGEDDSCCRNFLKSIKSENFNVFIE